MPSRPCTARLAREIDSSTRPRLESGPTSCKQLSSASGESGPNICSNASSVRRTYSALLANFPNGRAKCRYVDETGRRTHHRLPETASLILRRAFRGLRQCSFELPGGRRGELLALVGGSGSGHAVEQHPVGARTARRRVDQLGQRVVEQPPQRGLGTGQAGGRGRSPGRFSTDSGKARGPAGEQPQQGHRLGQSVRSNASSVNCQVRPTRCRGPRSVKASAPLVDELDSLRSVLQPRP